MRRSIDQEKHQSAQRGRPEVTSRHRQGVGAVAKLDPVRPDLREREAFNRAARYLHGECGQPAVNVVDQHAEGLRQSRQCVDIPKGKDANKCQGGNDEVSAHNLSPYLPLHELS